MTVVVRDRLFKGLPLPPSGDSSVLFLIKPSSGSANGHHCTQAHAGCGVGTELGGTPQPVVVRTAVDAEMITSSPSLSGSNVLRPRAGT